MKNIKSLIASIAIVGLVGLAVGTGAGAVNIAATVTPKLVSVTVDVTAIDYGIIDTSTTDNIPTETAPGTTVDPVITVTNNGNVVEDFAIRGADATGGQGDTIWNLVDGAPNDIATDAYQHKFTTDTVNLTGLAPLPEDANGDPENATLTTNLPVNDTETFKLRLDMPTGTTGFGERSTTVTVVATAS